MSDRFEGLPTPLAGLTLLQRHPLSDQRGYLERLYCESELQPWLPGVRVAQANRTFTIGRGTVRGMHWQAAPHAEIKIISCLRGSVFDVAVDVRRGSPTFLRWHAEILSAENHRSFLLAEGFAHGFQTLTDDCEMLYFHSAAYAPRAERGLHPQDPRLGIGWPLPIAELSQRDGAHPLLGADFLGFSP
jgi:dTDP-4-dehydrorhamnose 3,5-epimerase